MELVKKKDFVCLFYLLRFAHPYQYELDHFTPPDSVLQKPQPQVSTQLTLWLVSE